MDPEKNPDEMENTVETEDTEETTETENEAEAKEDGTKEEKGKFSIFSKKKDKKDEKIEELSATLGDRFEFFLKLKAIYDSTSIATRIGGRSNARTVEVLESGTVILECKDGPWTPLAPEDVLEI